MTMMIDNAAHYLERGAGAVRHVWRWVSDANGSFDGEQVEISGILDVAVTVPSVGAAPTDDYDVTLITDEGEDVLLGLLADRDTANTERVYILRATTTGDAARVLVGGLYRLTVRNAGDTKMGIVALTVRL